MDIEEKKKLLDQGYQLLKGGYPKLAIEPFEKILEDGERMPLCLSLLGLAIMRSGGDKKRAIELCKEAVRMDIAEPQYYINLAEACQRAGIKSWAVKAIQMGLNKADKNSHLLQKEMKKFGLRKRPPIPFLSRSNPINKFIGIILSRLKSWKS